MILRHHRFFSPYTILIFIIGLLSGSQSIADDWPQWRGPERNGTSQEKDLLKTWPDEGPALLWSKEGIGTGFSSVSIAKGRLYINGAIDKQGRQEDHRHTTDGIFCRFECRRWISFMAGRIQ